MSCKSGYEPVQPIPQALLRKYILYARTRVQPTLSTMDVDKVSRLYAELRRESLAAGSIPITVRHVESIVRMSEAHARMHLRDAVRADDIDLAIRVALESFISSQKYSVMNHLKKVLATFVTLPHIGVCSLHHIPPGHQRVALLCPARIVKGGPPIFAVIQFGPRDDHSLA